MFDVNEKEKRILPSWILQNLSDLQFSSIYDPFSGNARLGQYFKKMGFQVITSDILQCNYWWNKAFIDNNGITISEQTKNQVTGMEVTVSSIFSDWTDSFFTADECRSLEIWNTNINQLPVSDEEKALLFVAIYLTMDYWITYNKRYFQNKAMNPSETLNYYIDLVNKRVFDNGMPNVSYYYDSYDIASQIPTEVVYIYPPSKDGFRNYNMKFYLWECWTRRVSQLNLEGVISKAEHPKLGETFNDMGSYAMALDAFFGKIRNNPVWAISYNDQIAPDKEMLYDIIKNYKTIKKDVEIEMPYPTAAGASVSKEGLIIAVS